MSNIINIAKKEKKKRKRRTLSHMVKEHVIPTMSYVVEAWHVRQF